MIMKILALISILLLNLTLAEVEPVWFLMDRNLKFTLDPDSSYLYIKAEVPTYYWLAISLSG